MHNKVQVEKKSEFQLLFLKKFRTLKIVLLLNMFVQLKINLVNLLKYYLKLNILQIEQLE